MSLETFWNGLGTTFLETDQERKSTKRRSSRGKKDTRVNYMADFETTTDPADCRVWSWGVVDIDHPDYDDVEIGLDITSFIEWISRRNSNCYFHNLKFDGRFILDWLLNNGYTHIEGADLYDEGTFKTLISDMGSFYSVTVKWFNGFTTEFRDSLKKLPMGVRRIAKAFKLEMSKGDIDYEAYRAPGHKLTTEEEDYLRRDVVIVAKAMQEVIASGMKKLTVAADAMYEYKQLNGMDYFQKMFPVLDTDMDAEIRRAYRGGFTYADDRFKGRVVGSGLVFDVNSLYPSVMKYRAIPYGVPEFARGRVEPTEARPLTIFSVTFTAKLKQDHIPCIQIKGSNLFLGTEYLRVIEEPTTMMVTNVDWALYNDHYDIDVLSYGGGWRFKAVVGAFDTYIDKWSEIKAKETGGKREIAKLHLNSLYGKFASNPNVTGKVPVLENGVVKLVRGKPETRPPVYTAAGVFITAYARDITIRAAQDNYDVFAYADTDSLHLLQDTIPENLDVHPTRLGAWKHEYNFNAAFYIRPKAYLERKGYENVHNDECAVDCQSQHHYENRIAGLPLPVSSSLTFDDLVEGRVLHGKLNPKSVPGGVVLRDVPFELKLH